MLHSLFWKIFTLIFLANLLVIIAAIYYFIPTQFHERFETLSLNAAETIIKQIESGQAIDLSQLNQQILPHEFQRRHRWGTNTPLRDHILSRRLRITDNQGQIVFGQLGPNNNHELIHFNYQSQSEQTYQIEAKPPIKQRALNDLLRQIRTIRFIILFFSTLIVSLILSLFIVRPLKQLGKHARSLAGGDIHTRVEQNLLKRRDEIGDLSREFNEMASTVDQLISSKQQLLYDVSHELRAPLARLQATAALMQQQHDSNPTTIERIERECTRMNTLIQEILDYARLQNDLEHNETPTPVNLFKLFNRLVENSQQEFPQHPIRFIQTQTQLCIPGHANMLERAFENIVRNACKHTPEQTAIDIRIQSTAQQIDITIRDHGPGIKDEDLNNLTTPFFRANNTQNSEGYGLGLHISHRIVNHLQGTITIKNHAEGGLLVSAIFRTQPSNKNTNTRNH